MRNEAGFFQRCRSCSRLVFKKLLQHPFWQATLTWLRAHPREGGVLAAILTVLIGPFLLKPADTTTPHRWDRRLVIVTPHPGLIRDEFGHAFAAHWKAKTGETLYIDWRVPGGTSEIAMLVKSEFSAAFEQHWKEELKREWTPEIAQTFLSEKSDSEARKTFLASDIGIGVDVMFGGGAYDFESQAKSGALVAGDSVKTGLSAVMKTHPEWFCEAAIPEKLSGEPFRDPAGRWCGACISSSGIVYNKDVLKRLGIEKEPQTWADLADPRYFGQIACTDPAKSGSVTKVFEMLIQQQMHLAVEAEKAKPTFGKENPELELQTGVEAGWIAGLQLIQKIAGNARYFSDTSTKIPLDVVRGEAAAGMCIDFYGRTAQDDARKADGTSRIGFVAPLGGTSVSVDPIGMFRGAPNAEVATAFIEFVLSEAGQKLWSFRPGTPGGPREHALRRLPVRRDFYTPANLPHMPDAAEMPFEKASAFVYEAERTGPAFNSIRFLVRVLCVDSHEELKTAWREILEASMNERALTVLLDLNRVKYDTATGPIRKTLSSRDKIQETLLARQLGDTFRSQYSRAFEIAHRRQ